MHQALVLLLLAQKMLLANLILPNDIVSLLPSVSTTDVVSIVNFLNQDQEIICHKCHFLLSDIFHFPWNIVQSVIDVFRKGCAAGWIWCKSAIPVVGSN